MLTRKAQVIIIGGGLAGISAAIYLARAKRRTLVVDEGRSMARWEPDVQNYLGFPSGVAGSDLVRRGRRQAVKFGASFCRDRIVSASRRNGRFSLRGSKGFYTCDRLLLATGIFHVPPDLPALKPCLGHSMFFCRDCDGYRVQSQSIGIYGWTDEAVEYGLGMLLYSPCVTILTDGRKPEWGRQHQAWISEYRIPVCTHPIETVRRTGNRIRSLVLADQTEVFMTALFTTRGDIYYNEIGRELDAKLDRQGQVVVDEDMRTSVPALYAAGCLTPANCQMIIAAGEGATAAQAINRDLFDESLANHNLHRFRSRQLRTRPTRPRRRRSPALP